MEFGTRRSGYRDVAIRCPGCAEPMHAAGALGADVDVCSGCGGIWLDWFDGDIGAVAAAIVEQGPAASLGFRGGASAEPVAGGACPRCALQLVAERYVVHAVVPGAEGPVVTSTPTGAELLRCEACAGAFVSRASAETLALLPDDDTPPPSSASARALRPLPWERLLAAIRRVLGTPRGFLP